MKRTITLLIATALIFGMSQCKKNVETITPSNLGEAVHITVNVDDGGKHIVYPGTGAYVFENGDKLYVGNNGKYRGTLTYNSGAFSGTINSPSTNDYLHFYFVGGLTPSATPSAGNTASFTVNIANQSSKLPVLSYAHSTQKYINGTTTYGCTLLNKCGLVKFVPATATSAAIAVGGMKTTATINFATGSEGITPTGATGNVTLYSESNSAKWAVLLPQTAVSTPPVTIAGYNSTITSVPAVTENMYYTNGGNGVSIAMESVLPPYIDAEFTVASGTTVKFSKGNLQYQASTNTWRFAENQYDYVGNAVGNTAPSSTQSGWMDLFGWGTSGISGYSPIATCYQPWSTSTNDDQYNPYGSTSTNLYDGGSNKGKADWGYNAISNGGNTQNFGWRTLTSAEWAWVLGPNSDADPGTNCRTSSTVNNVQNARFAKATVNSKAGVIIFPDSYSGGTPSGVTWGTINGTSNGYTTTCTVDGWAALEAAGCVFLPAAGYRNGTSVSNAGSDGRYWTSKFNSPSNGYRVTFGSSNFLPSDNGYRSRGYSVRLVCNVEQ